MLPGEEVVPFNDLDSCDYGSEKYSILSSKMSDENIVCHFDAVNAVEAAMDEVEQKERNEAMRVEEDGSGKMDAEYASSTQAINVETSARYVEALENSENATVMLPEDHAKRDISLLDSNDNHNDGTRVAAEIIVEPKQVKLSELMDTHCDEKEQHGRTADQKKRSSGALNSACDQKGQKQIACKVNSNGNGMDGEMVGAETIEELEQVKLSETLGTPSDEKEYGNTEDQTNRSIGVLDPKISSSLIGGTSLLQLGESCDEKNNQKFSSESNSCSAVKIDMAEIEDKEQCEPKNEMEDVGTVEEKVSNMELENTMELKDGISPVDNKTEINNMDSLGLKEGKGNTKVEKVDGFQEKKVDTVESKKRCGLSPNMEPLAKKIKMGASKDICGTSVDKSENGDTKGVDLRGQNESRKNMDEDVSTKKKNEMGIDKGIGGLPNTVDSNKIKNESAENKNIAAVDRKKPRPSVPAWRLEKAEVRGGRVFDLKTESLEARDKVKIKGKGIASVSKGIDKLPDRKMRNVELQVHEKPKLRSTSSSSGDPPTKKGASQEVIRVQGKSGLLKILPKKKGSEGKTKVDACHSTSTTATSRSPEMHAQKRSYDGSRSISDHGKTSGPSASKNPRKEEMKLQGSKSHLSISSRSHKISKLHLKGEKTRNYTQRKNEGDTAHELEGRSSAMGAHKKSKYEGEEPVSPPSLNCSTSKATEGRKTMKQKLREQIKQILLNAGWKIELRPRKGRSYEDSVYVSPHGTGYWSITKAYAAFQDHNKQGQNGKTLKDSSETRSIERATVRSTLPSIGKEELNMLKRNIINKRRTKEQLSVANKKQEKIRSMESEATALKSKQRGFALQARGFNTAAEGEMDDFTCYEWKRTLLSWMIDLGVISEDGKVMYKNKKRRKASLDGTLKREGIHCSCCSKILSVSKFELHAGSKDHQPYENICVEDSGVPLLQCLLDAWKKQEPEKGWFYDVDTSDDPSDDTCGICGDGGALICCDSCPSTFHLSCLEIEMLPPGEWQCRNCLCIFCELASLPGVVESRATSAALLSCSLCAKKFHQLCQSESSSPAPPTSNAVFCCLNCRKVFRKLQKMIGVRNDMEAGFSWSIVQRFDDNLANSSASLLKRIESNSKTAVAFAVLDECFCPIVDERSGISILHNVVYNCRSNYERINYGGFYTFILERGDEIVSAASVRIHGSGFAEMPFIGTRYMYRRQGMCRRLLDGIESALRTVNVERLIIPAISEMKKTWTEVFGFKPLEANHIQQTRSANMLIFPVTGLLQKPLLSTLSDQSSPKVESNIYKSKTGGVDDHESSSSVPGPDIRDPVRKNASSSLTQNLPTDELGASVAKGEKDQSSLKTLSGSGGVVKSSNVNAVSPQQNLDKDQSSETHVQQTADATCSIPEERQQHSCQPVVATKTLNEDKGCSKSSFPLIPIDSIMSVISHGVKLDVQNVRPLVNDRKQDCEEKIDSECSVGKVFRTITAEGHACSSDVLQTSGDKCVHDVKTVDSGSKQNSCPNKPDSLQVKDGDNTCKTKDVTVEMDKDTPGVTNLESRESATAP